MKRVLAILFLFTASQPVVAQSLGYKEAALLAVANREPLVVFVNCPDRGLYGAVSCYEKSFDPYKYPPACVIVCVPRDGWLIWAATLPTNATAAQISQAAYPPEQAVQPLASPFVSRPPLDADGNSLLPVGAIEAMDELNQQRARNGIPPFIRDDGLTIAAARCASDRAARLVAGHLNDFAYLPEGSQADASGCGAWEVGTVTTRGQTFGTCCMDDVGYRYAGAAWVMGRDGKRYCHLFVRR